MIDFNKGILCTFLVHGIRPDGTSYLSGDVIVACIPKARIEPIVEDISATEDELREALRKSRSILTDGEYQRIVAECDACSLCKVCAGDHRRYFDYSWPVGGGKCFVNLQKSGKPLQDEPCALCEEHDAEYRKMIGDRKRGLGNSSRLKNKLRNLKIARRQLFDEFRVETRTFKDY